MTEKELIKKLKELKEIKPSEEWVVLTKENIIREGITENRAFLSSIGSIFNVRPLLKPVLAGAFCFSLLFGVFVLSQSQNVLPGDLLYSVKKISEQARLSLASEEEKPKVQLELTQKKLDELRKIAEENRGKNLASAVQEVEESMKQTAESLKKVAEVRNDGKIVKEVKEKVDIIEEQKGEVESILSTKLNSQELDEAKNSYYKSLVEQEIEELENSELTLEQNEFLEQAKELFQEGNYQEALEKILFLSY